MTPFYKTLWLALLSCLITLSLHGQPAGFVDQEYVSGFQQAVGMTFDANGRMYVWEKGGKVWIVENGERLPDPLIDLSDEVGNWRDFGLLGFTLDPDFLANGYIYLLYIVDRHHLLYAGTSDYNPNTNDYFSATIGRVTRYQAQLSTGFNTVDYASRAVLLGDSPSTGFPNLHQSHGTGSLIFGTDGSLLASFGDGASYSSVDEGSASETYYQQAIDDGIITSAQNIGAYRTQLLDCLAGKAVRIDPMTGAGLPSNPFYQSNNPNSIRSKVWALGLRNPCRMTLKPETGSHDQADGDPGAIYIGDVGWGNREELSVMAVGGLNFGWPKYEGMTHEPGYNNSTYAPSSHELPKVDWRNGTPRAYVNGTIYQVGSSQVPGPTFQGNASIGGVWVGSSPFFPQVYQNTYFHADYGGDWIRNFSFDDNHNCTEVRNFKTGADAIVYVATDPDFTALYYLGGASGNSNGGQNAVRRIVYTGGNLPPIASASANILYGSSPLTVQFTGELSYDIDGDPITFAWDFGDGNTSNAVNPQHTFTASGGQPTAFNVTLTVTDPEGLEETQTLIISLNNTPPQILSTSIDNINNFNLDFPTPLDLSATVSDAEHSNASLTYEWITELHHNDHYHQEPVDNNPVTSTELSPIGCDGSTYFYRIKLRVIDPAGLFSSYHKDIFPACGGNSQTITFAPLSDKLTIDAPFTVSATSNSGLPVILHVVEGPASISGNTISLSGNPGLVTVRAIQSGDMTYAPALPVEHQFTVSPPGGTGLQGQYYNNMNLTNIALERIDPVIDFDWGNGSPDGSMGVNTYSVRWSGEVLPAHTENYTFTTTTDDGVRLWVNDFLIIDEWVDQSATAHSGTISMTAGERVPIVMEFYENGGQASAKLEWSSPNQSQQVVPQFLLFPEAEAPDTEPPTVLLNTPSNEVTTSFVVTVAFNEPVTSLSANDFIITNGTISNLSGSGDSYSFQVSPQAEGNISIQLPANQAEDAAGNGNLASNTLNVNYTEPATGDCSSPSNIAEGKTAVHSSDYGNNGAGPELAVDGNTNGNWYLDFSVSSTGWQNDPWWEVDLSSVSEIQELRIWNRTDCCADFLDNYYILISESPFNSNNLNVLLSDPDVQSFHQTTTAGTPSTVITNVNGRYVRLQKDGTGFMALAEAEVIGCEGMPGTGTDTTPPTVMVSTSSSNVSGAFTVDVQFSEVINGLSLSDFDLNNGSASNLGGTGAAYSFTVTPNVDGEVTIQLPASAVTDNAGNENTASNLLSVTYTMPGTGGECNSPYNLAENKAASQSSDYGNNLAGPELAVDGNTNGNWYLDYSVSSTGWQSQPWWEVDLGEVSSIDWVNIWNRTDCCSNFLSDYYVFVSDAPFISESLNATLNQAGVTAYHQTEIAGSPSLIPINRNGRYVRVQSTGTGFVALAEVEVFGCPEDGDPNNDDTTPPEATLSNADNPVSGSFEVALNFSEVITGLTLSDLVLTNASASNLNGNGVVYSFTATPDAEGELTIELPANQVTDIAGNPNNASNLLTVEYVAPTNGGDCTSVSNLALNGTATQSSIYANGGGEPELAIDDNTSGNWYLDYSVSSTGWQNQPWWEVDLGNINEIDYIDLWNRTDCCSNFLNNYYVLVSDAPFVSSNLNEVLSQPGVSSYIQNTIGGTPSTVEIGRTGRYVRIQKIDAGFMALAEVQVMGCPTSSANSNSSWALNRPSTADQDRGLKLRLYPNPVEDFVVVEYETSEAGELVYFVSNSLGTVMAKSSLFTDIGRGKIVIPVSMWSSGFYTFYIKMDGFRFQQKNFVKIRD